MFARTIASMLVLVLLTVAPSVAASPDPMETIRKPIDELIVILNDPKYKVPGTKAVQREEIWKTVKPMFDFVEISKRTVARNWNDFSESEKVAFTDVFSRFLGNTYIDKIQGEYHNEKVVYLGQDLFSDRYAEVKTQILRETVQIPVNYRLFKNNAGQWKVYDIIVEGISLVKNYRTQFASILQKDKPATLIEMLNAKLTEQNNRLSTNG